MVVLGSFLVTLGADVAIEDDEFSLVSMQSVELDRVLVLWGGVSGVILNADAVIEDSDDLVFAVPPFFMLLFTSFLCWWSILGWNHMGDTFI